MIFARFSNLKQFKNKFEFGQPGVTHGSTGLVRTGSGGLAPVRH
jgi:hypothetical protein